MQPSTVSVVNGNQQMQPGTTGQCVQHRTNADAEPSGDKSSAQQQQSGANDTSVLPQQQQQQQQEHQGQQAAGQVQQTTKDEQQQQMARQQRPVWLQQVPLASKHRVQQQSQPRLAEPLRSPIKREPAISGASVPAPMTTLGSQPAAAQQQEQKVQVPLQPTPPQHMAGALQQQQQQQPMQVLQQQHHPGAQRQQCQQQGHPGVLFQQQEAIVQQQQHSGPTMSFDSDRSAGTAVHDRASLGQDRLNGLRNAVVAPQTAAGAATATGVSNASTATAATGSASAGATPSEVNVSSNTSPSQLMQMIVAQARKMRAEQAIKAKELRAANKKLQKLQQQKEDLQQELESQGAFEGIDIDTITEQQLQEMVDKVAEQRREVAEQLAAEERELEVQQQLLHDLQEQDREMDARLQRALMEHLELLQRPRYMADRMVE